jgi:hypothetical protein
VLQDSLGEEVDIQITGAIQSGKYILISRVVDGANWIERMPKETLAIRAAEYDLEPDDPRVLDQVLLEGFYVPEDPDEIHPLFKEATVADALAIMEQRIEQVRNDNGAPKEPAMRSLFHAADLDASTQGLTDAKRLLLDNVDPDLAQWVKINRDEGRKAPAPVEKTMGEIIKERGLGYVIEEAKLEDNSRMRDARAVDLPEVPASKERTGK